MEPGAATGRLEGIYEAIRARSTSGKVSSLWQAWGLDPSGLEASFAHYRALMDDPSPLSPPQAELIALVVSATNGCAYCVNSHTAALRKLGMDAEALGEVLAIVGLFNMTNALAEGYQVEPDVLPPVE